jgi:hypothetical protein
VSLDLNIACHEVLPVSERTVYRIDCDATARSPRGRFVQIDRIRASV